MSDNLDFLMTPEDNKEDYGEHTPGPWTVEELTNANNGMTYSYVEANKGWANSGMAGRRTVAIVGHWKDRPNPQADAALIASAPELAAENRVLREALERAKNGVQWWVDTYPELTSEADYEFLQEVDAALEGRQE